MNFDDIENLIVEKLHALGRAKKFDTYEVDIPIGTDRKNVGHAIQPYVIIDFGNKGQQASPERGITGTRDDMRWISIVFEVVSNNPAVTRKIASILRNEFDGYIAHETWGEMVERVSAPLYSRQMSEGGELFPPRYYRTIGYVVDVDA